MSVPLPESDSEDELPPAWEERATNDGFVYYVNHHDKSTQWTHPRTGKMKRVSGDLPLGWTKHVEESTGKIIFLDEKTQRKSYTDPRLAFAVEESAQVGELRQRFDSGTSALQVLHGRDLSGKVALITGCNAGIGFETARSLALHGCEIIFACRNETATKEAIERIAKEKSTAGQKCSFVKLDLASLESTRECAAQVKSRWKHLDMLILNAGVFALPYSTTEDGFETTFQVSHLSHFLLTTLLSELLDHTSRIVVVSSESHRFSMLTKLSESDLSPPPNKYWSMVAYNNAKLFNVLFAAELARRWKTRGISVFSLHPGNMVSSQIARNWWFYRVLFALVRPFTKSLQQAASTTIYCATAHELNGLTGLYFNNCYVCEPSGTSKSKRMQQSLWELSEQLVERVAK
ncbi:WW domain-containing oxidoreductase [Culex quinquefasciatus]|uniref:WW domain-containing oxidoreductase n=1 Tax=Culex quinquefasciatus TaxID=7176 RepID=B0WCM6_CULQU|nr:WW domain-containing oxidoreductase [Culex quinquefasciatus]|eukprot:XP_001846460.1 WW domain-containing oxidoreductase [Culex quinquefasciatus]